MGKEKKIKKPADAKALKTEIKALVGMDPIELEIKREELSKKYSVRKKSVDDYLYQLNKEYLVDTQSVVDEVEPCRRIRVISRGSPVAGCRSRVVPGGQLSRRKRRRSGDPAWKPSTATGKASEAQSNVGGGSEYRH